MGSKPTVLLSYASLEGFCATGNHFPWEKNEPGYILQCYQPHSLMPCVVGPQIPMTCPSTNTKRPTAHVFRSRIQSL